MKRIAFTLFVCFGLAVSQARADDDHGRVLDPEEKIDGWSLRLAAQQHALFLTSNNDLHYLAVTPYQELYATQESASFVNGVFTATGTGSFHTDEGTRYYVPILSFDDSPLFLVPYPASACDAARYFFDPALLGTTNLTITVDGVTHKLGPEFLAGPVTTPPLFDGGGTHIIQFGVFLSPLSPGHHTVTITGDFTGTGFAQLFGFIQLSSFSYTVDVARGHAPPPHPPLPGDAESRKTQEQALEECRGQ
jgi:hypothetical protein